MEKWNYKADTRELAKELAIQRNNKKEQEQIKE